MSTSCSGGLKKQQQKTNTTTRFFRLRLPLLSVHVIITINKIVDGEQNVCARIVGILRIENLRHSILTPRLFQD